MRGFYGKSHSLSMTPTAKCDRQDIDQTAKKRTSPWSAMPIRPGSQDLLRCCSGFSWRYGKYAKWVSELIVTTAKPISAPNRARTGCRFRREPGTIPAPTGEATPVASSQGGTGADALRDRNVDEDPSSCLGRAPLVPVMKSADLRYRNNGSAFRRLHGPRFRRVLGQ